MLERSNAACDGLFDSNEPPTMAAKANALDIFLHLSIKNTLCNHARDMEVTFTRLALNADPSESMYEMGEKNAQWCTSRKFTLVLE